MGLAERLNPEKEALCIAVGKGIYVWAYDKPYKLTTNLTPVSSLATKGTRLVFADGFGLRDSLEGRIVSEKPWWKVATDVSGKIYGVMDPMFADSISPDGSVIVDVDSFEPVKYCSGDTNLLVGRPFLMDSGSYVDERGVIDSSLFDTLNDEVVAYGRLMGVEQFKGVAAAKTLDKIYLAANSVVELREKSSMDPFVVDALNQLSNSYGRASGKKAPEIPMPEHEKVFEITAPIFEEFLKAGTLSNYFNNHDLNAAEREEVWAEFCRVLVSVRPYVPGNFFKLKYHKRKPAIELKPVPLNEAERHYAPVLEIIRKARERDDSFADDSPPLGKIMSVVMMNLKNRCFSMYGINAMEKCNNHLVMGLGTGELVMKGLDGGDPYVVWHFGKPISSLLTVPMEVFNDGIRQHVLERIRQRAYFAGRGGEYKFLGVPQPFKKAA